MRSGLSAHYYSLDSDEEAVNCFCRWINGNVGFPDFETILSKGIYANPHFENEFFLDGYVNIELGRQLSIVVEYSYGQNVARGTDKITFDDIDHVHEVVSYWVKSWDNVQITISGGQFAI